jgi:TonB family protein
MSNVRSRAVAVALVLAGGALWLAPSLARADEPPEPPVGGPGAEGDYLRLIHQRIHPGWLDGYIRVTPYSQIGPSTAKTEAQVALTVRWDGTIEKAEIAKSSGSLEFDAAAMNAIWFGAPFPPPVDVLADDGFAHLTWRFARDFRLCSGGAIVRVEFPLQAALPNLASRGRLTEAVRRMSDELAHQGWTDDFLSPFVRLWLARPNLSNDLDARAAAALALAGDRQHLKYLQNVLLQPATTAIAAPAMERLGIDVGALLTAAAAAPTADQRSMRWVLYRAIRAEPRIAASCPTCVSTLAAASIDPRQPVRERLGMIAMLGDLDQTLAIEQALAEAAQDPNLAIRGAALLAQTPRDRGRIGVIHLAPLLHDPAPEIRAAAAAGVLRAGGDLGLEQLFLLSRERDSRVLLAAASELARMTSDDSAKMLGRMLKRSDKSVRAAALAALAARTDPVARKLVDPILAAARTNASEDPAVRILAIPGAQPGELVALSADSRLGLAGYRGLLVANQRAAAARWLLANLEQLSPEDRIAAMGDWIAEAPKYAARR